MSEWAEDERLRFEVQGTVHIRVQGLGRVRVSPAPFDPTRRTRAPERTEKLRPLTESGNRHSGTENRSKGRDRLDKGTENRSKGRDCLDKGTENRIKARDRRKAGAENRNKGDGSESDPRNNGAGNPQRRPQPEPRGSAHDDRHLSSGGPRALVS